MKSCIVHHQHMGLPLSILIPRQPLYQYFQPVFYNFPRTRAFKYQWLDELFLPAHCGNKIMNRPKKLGGNPICERIFP